MGNVKNYESSGRLFISESEKSFLIYDRNTGNLHRLEDKENLETLVERVCKEDEVASNFVKTESDAVKINLSNVCNLNCDYCFRDKMHRMVTNVEKAKQIIDFVVDKLRPGFENYTFSLNLTSEAMIELDKILEIKNYLDNKLYPFFTERQFNSVKEINSCLKSLPYKLFTNPFTVDSIKTGVDLLNGLLDRKDLSSFFPIPEGMVLPNWEANEIAKVNELSGYALRLCNIRFLEAVLPDVFIRKPCYVLSVCTNGTLFSKQIVDFLHSINVDCITISLDGPREVNDLHRKDNSGKPTYDLVVENIRKFKDAGFNVSVAAVMTPDFPYPLEIVEHLRTLGVSSIGLNPVRAGNEFSFCEDSMELLLDGYKKLFEKLLEDVKHDDYSLINLLKSDNIFIGIMAILKKNRIIKRCLWNEQLIFDGKGDIYPCDYFIGNKKFLRGNLDSLELKDILEDKIQVDLRGNCKDCWCKFMCGGTCFYNSYKNVGSIENIDKVECKFSKGLRILCIWFVHNLLDYGIDLVDFAKKADLGFSKKLNFNNKFCVKNGIFFKFRGTLTKFEIKIREIFEKLEITLNPEIYTSVVEIEETKRSKILYANVLIPIEKGVEKINKSEFLVVRDFDFGRNVGGRVDSNDQKVENLKSEIIEQIKSFRMPATGIMWYRGTVDAFLGYRKEEVDVFMQLQPNVY